MVVIHQREAEIIGETDRQSVARLRDKLAAAMVYGRLSQEDASAGRAGYLPR
jgi:hypothetical protein